MKKLKRILAYAAALITAGGMALGLALSTANQAEVKPLTCGQWDRVLTRAKQQRSMTWFIAVKSGYVLPPASSERILGNCSEGECLVQVVDCPHEQVTLSYEYKSSMILAGFGGWRIVRFDGPRRFAIGWRQLAAKREEVKFWRSFRAVKSRCRADFTLSYCLELIDMVNRCWLRPDGQLCRGLGRGEWGLYGPGVGGDVACVPGIDDVPYPCSDKARGQAWAAQAHLEVFPTDEELELP